MPTHHCLRLATPDDAPALGQLHVDAWRETYAGLLPDAMLAELSVEGRTGLWAHILGLPPAPASTRVHAATQAGAIVGFGACGGQRTAWLGEQGFDGEISALYVLGKAQGAGIGTALMRAMAATLVEHGHRGAALWVLRENARARRFYEKLGGVVVGEQEEARIDGVLVEVAYGWPDLRGLIG